MLMVLAQQIFTPLVTFYGQAKLLIGKIISKSQRLRNEKIMNCHLSEIRLFERNRSYCCM